MSLPVRRIEIPYAPRVQQREVHALLERHRFGVLVCHRRFGKTVLGVNHLIKGAVTCKRERPRFGYIAPTYTQGKSTAFDYFRHYSAPIPGHAVNQSELRVDYPNYGQVRIYGADNPDSLRGLYFDGVVEDEFGLHPAKAHSEVIGPTLVDRGGWALFGGTPNGKNQFYELAKHAKARVGVGDPDWFYREYPASVTGIIDPKELERAAREMTTDEYAQEYECSFEASVKGAIYAREMEAARSEKRITVVPYDSALPVDTDWDLGIGDSMAIWFSQTVRGSGQARMIDYFEASGEGFPFYANVLARKGYVYGQHWAPHDISVRELGSGKSRLDVAADLGLRFRVTPRINSLAGQEVEEGIHATRLFLGRCWFDAEKCARGIEALMHYRRDYNQRLGEFKTSPVHDAASHGADAMRGRAVRDRVETSEVGQFAAPPMPRQHSWS